MRRPVMTVDAVHDPQLSAIELLRFERIVR